MPGHRFFQDFLPTDKKIVLSDADEIAHLSRVLRLAAGDAVEIINGRGVLANGTIEDVGKGSVTVMVREIITAPRSAAPTLTLACAIPKKAKFETIIEKCTELGVDRMVPLTTERGDVVVDEGGAARKLARFTRVVMNAAKQCKRLWIPEITPVMDLSGALAKLAGPGVKMFIPWLEGPRISFQDALVQAEGASVIVFFIGPEGDFAPQEIAAAVAAGAVPVSLGDNVLKVDTAAIAVIAAACLLRKPSSAR